MNYRMASFTLAVVLCPVFVLGCVSRRDYLAKERENKIFQQEMDTELRERQRIIRRLLNFIDDQIKGGNIGLAKEMEKLEGELSVTKEQLGEAEKIAEKRQRELQELKRTYNELVEDLKEEIKQGAVKIEHLGERLSLQFVDRILFDSASAEINAKGQGVMTRVGEILKKVKEKDIQVQGHTDNQALRPQAQFPTNWELSVARATNVVRYLQEKVGVNPELLWAVGFSRYRPVASNNLELSRPLNRRIEVVLVPKFATRYMRKQNDDSSQPKKDK